MNLSYMPAKRGDIPVIFAQAKALVDAYEDKALIDYEKVLLWLQTKIEKHIDSYTAVYLEEEKVAYFHLCSDGELDDLYVLPPFCGKGIGSEILKFCMQKSTKPLYLYVFSKNTRAIALYKKFGFADTKAVSPTRKIMVQNG